MRFVVLLVRQPVALSACSLLQSCVRGVGCDCAFSDVSLPVLDVVADSSSGFSTDSSGTRVGDNSDHLYFCPVRAGYESSDDEDNVMPGREYERSPEGDSDSDDEDVSYGEPADMFKGVYVQRDVALPAPLMQGLSRPDAAFQGPRPSEADLGDMLHHFTGEYSHPLFPSSPGVNGVQHLGGTITHAEWLHNVMYMVGMTSPRTSWSLALSASIRAVRLSFTSFGSGGCLLRIFRLGMTRTVFNLIGLYGLTVMLRLCS